jgi:hypothetical protein
MKALLILLATDKQNPIGGTSHKSVIEVAFLATPKNYFVRCAVSELRAEVYRLELIQALEKQGLVLISTDAIKDASGRIQYSHFFDTPDTLDINEIEGIFAD